MIFERKKIIIFLFLDKKEERLQGDVSNRTPPRKANFEFQKLSDFPPKILDPKFLPPPWNSQYHKKTKVKRQVPRSRIRDETKQFPWGAWCFENISGRLIFFLCLDFLLIFEKTVKLFTLAAEYSQDPLGQCIDKKKHSHFTWPRNSPRILTCLTS